MNFVRTQSGSFVNLARVETIKPVVEIGFGVYDLEDRHVWEKKFNEFNFDEVHPAYNKVPTLVIRAWFNEGSTNLAEKPLVREDFDRLQDMANKYIYALMPMFHYVNGPSL